MRRILLLLIIMSCMNLSYANGYDSLTLTDAEIAKLKNIFPADSASTHRTTDIDVSTIKNTGASDSVTINQNNIPNETGTLNYVDLIRYAWQTVYAPTRLLNNMTQYQRVPLKTSPFVSNLVLGDKVFAHPVASWFINNEYVTAIALQNKYPHIANINLSKDICGDWKAGTLYPRDILKPTKEADSTTLFLISNQPFAETFGVCNGNA